MRESNLFALITSYLLQLFGEEYPILEYMVEKFHEQPEEDTTLKYDEN